MFVCLSSCKSLILYRFDGKVPEKVISDPKFCLTATPFLYGIPSICETFGICYVLFHGSDYVSQNTLYPRRIKLWTKGVFLNCRKFPCFRLERGTEYLNGASQNNMPSSVTQKHIFCMVCQPCIDPCCFCSLNYPKIAFESPPKVRKQRNCVHWLNNQVPMGRLLGICVCEEGEK